MLVVLAGALAGGCATVVPQARPLDPVSVYIADYGIHSSLMLPVRSDRYVEYCFGDWDYAAKNHCGPHNAVGALLVSSQAALGRRFLDLPPGEASPQPPEHPKRLLQIFAARADVNHLLDELNDRFSRSLDTVQINSSNDIEFVKDPEHYSWFNNCNDLTAQSLRELHCQVHGWVGTSKFHLSAVAQAGEATIATPATIATTAPSTPTTEPTGIETASGLTASVR